MCKGSGLTWETPSQKQGCCRLRNSNPESWAGVACCMGYSLGRAVTEWQSFRLRGISGGLYSNPLTKSGPALRSDEAAQSLHQSRHENYQVWRTYNLLESSEMKSMARGGGLSHSQEPWLVGLQFWEPSLLGVAISSVSLPSVLPNVQRCCDTFHAQDIGE